MAKMPSPAVAVIFALTRPTQNPVIGAVLVVFGVCILSGSALAQAWLPPAGERTVTLTYQTTTARGELDKDGNPYWEEGKTRTHGFTPDLEWGVSERLAVNLALPYIAARYRGDHAHTFDHHGGPSSIDDGTYHDGAQDFRFAVRYGLKRGAFAIAPFAEGVLPTHDYELIGHSAIGDGLWLFRTGVNVGGFLTRSQRSSSASVRTALDSTPRSATS